LPMRLMSVAAASNSTLVIYRDAGHGAIFQYPHEFVAKVLEFLAS
jgi:pimeloyl-ACP methyl ester carboxylesterase